MELLELKAVHDTGDGHEEGVLGLEASITLSDGLYLNARTEDYSQEMSLHIPRAELVKFVEAAQGFLEETREPLPTNMFATIKATIENGEGRATGVVLSRVDTDQYPWRAAARTLNGIWFEDSNIKSFEVLFPGVEA